jgi:hypothetical protein
MRCTARPESPREIKTKIRKPIFSIGLRMLELLPADATVLLIEEF